MATVSNLSSKMTPLRRIMTFYLAGAGLPKQVTTESFNKRCWGRLVEPLLFFRSATASNEASVLMWHHKVRCGNITGIIHAVEMSVIYWSTE